MQKKYLPLIILVAISLAGCAAQKTRTPPAEWDLSPQAEATFQFLRFNEDPHSKEGAKALKEAIQKDPSPYLYLELANYYWRQTNFKASRKILKEGIKLYPEKKNLYISLAKSYLAEGRKEAALTTILDCLKKMPGDASLIEDAASLYLQNDNCTNALDLLKKLPKDNRSAKAEYLWGRSQACLEQNRKAVSHLKKAVDKDPKLLKAWAELAYVHEKDKNYARAEEIYRKMISLQPDNKKLLLRVISLDLKLNEPDQAMLMVEKRPEDTVFKLNAAAKFLQNSYYSHAREILKNILQKKNPPEKTYLQLAILSYESSGDIGSAIKYLEKIPAQSDYYHRALRLRANLALETGKKNSAMQLVKEGLDKFPEDKEFWSLKAQVFQEKDQGDKALQVLEKGLKKWPKATELLTFKGLILEERGKREKALEVMEKIISIDPENAKALNFVGYILAEQEKNLDRALVLVKNALKQDPNNGYYQDSLAWVLFKQGELDKAWSKIQEAVSQTSDAVIWMHYADIARALQLWSKAANGYQKALKIGLNPEDKSRTKERLSQVQKRMSVE